jgi:hypothetical protein
MENNGLAQATNFVYKDTSASYPIELHIDIESEFINKHDSEHICSKRVKMVFGEDLAKNSVLKEALMIGITTVAKRIDKTVTMPFKIIVDKVTTSGELNPKNVETAISQWALDFFEIRE